MLKVNLSVGLIVALQLVTSLVLQLVVLAIVGIGRQTDAYIAAQAVPLVLLSILSVSLQSVWQPRLSKVSSELGEWHSAQCMAQGHALLLLGIPSIVLAITASCWAGLLFPGLRESELEMVHKMSRLLLCGAIFNGHATLFTMALRARGNFVVVEVINLMSGLLSIPAVWALLPRFGIEAAVWVSLIRSIIVCGVLCRLAGCPRPNPILAWHQRTIWRESIPLLASSSIYKNGPLVDRFWCSQSGVGGMTIFNLAQTATGALATIIERAICMPVGSQMGQLAGERKYTLIRSGYRQSVFRVTLAVAFVALGLIALLPVWSNLIGYVFKLEAAAAWQMWVICMLLLGFVHVAASGAIVVSVFYAMGDMKTPSLVLALGFAFGLVLKSAGFLTVGLNGLAAATSVYQILNFAVLSIIIERRLRKHIANHGQL